MGNREGLLKQMREKMSLNGETEENCMSDTSLPLGIPPVSLDGILLSEAWYPHFLTFLRENYTLAKDQDQLKLLRECERLFSWKNPSIRTIGGKWFEISGRNARQVWMESLGSSRNMWRIGRKRSIITTIRNRGKYYRCWYL